MGGKMLEDLFKPFLLGTVELPNRFVFPPVKLGYGNTDGTVTDRQVRFYGRIAQEGPAVIILEPVSVTPDGKEHPRQLCVHLPEIEEIVAGFKAAAQKAVEAGFDLIEVQAGHGYLLSQFLNAKTNHRKDPYGQDRLRFAKDVLSAVKDGGQGKPIVVRISGNEMSPEFGISGEDLLAFLKWTDNQGIVAIHVGMGHACFSPPWYFHHGSLPLKPQLDALSWLRKQTLLPLIAAGRMG